MPTFPRETQSATVVGTTQVAKFRGQQGQRFIDRINITGPPGSACIVYIGSITAGNQVDGSASGEGDVAEYPKGLLVPSAYDVFFVWNSPTQNPAATATIQWRTDGV